MSRRAYYEAAHPEDSLSSGLASSRCGHEHRTPSGARRCGGARMAVVRVEASPGNVYRSAVK